MPESPAADQIDLLSRSDAFRDAALRSEERRAYAVLGVVAIIVAPLTILGASRPVEPNLLIIGVIAGAALVAIQVLTIAATRWARRRERTLPSWFDAAGVTIECSIPTAVILAHIELDTFTPHTALTAPPLLAYGLLIGLTTLRLRPLLCVWAGVVAASGYAGLFGFVAANHGLRPEHLTWPRIGFIMAGLMILTAGFAAAWVAREIRSHVEAALGEAETRRRMERLENDIGVARTIQQALLPREAPSIPGYEIAAWNRPADQTGGDYYDWQPLPDGRWIVSLADVSGHGIGPAMVTAACRAYVRASSAHHADLGSLAAHVNRLLSDDLPSGRFITMASVIVDPAGGPLAMLSAGHGPIVLCIGATGEVRDILPGDPPLAVVPDAVFGPAQLVELGPRDVLVLVTDGVVEWGRPGVNGARTMYGLDRLRAVLSRSAHDAAQSIIDAVIGDVSAFAAGTPQQDDVTMVAIRRIG